MVAIASAAAKGGQDPLVLSTQMLKSFERTRLCRLHISALEKADDPFCSTRCYIYFSEINYATTLVALG